MISEHVHPLLTQTRWKDSTAGREPGPDHVWTQVFSHELADGLRQPDAIGDGIDVRWVAMG